MRCIGREGKSWLMAAMGQPADQLPVRQSKYADVRTRDRGQLSAVGREGKTLKFVALRPAQDAYLSRARLVVNRDLW